MVCTDARIRRRRCLVWSLLSLLVLAIITEHQNNNAASSVASSPVAAARTSGSRRTTSGRVYCLVPFLWSPQSSHTHRAIHDTWGKRCDVLRFFVDPVIGIGGGDDDGKSEGGRGVGRPSRFFNVTSGAVVRSSSSSSAIDDADEDDVAPGNFTLPSDVVVLHDMRRPWHTCDRDDCRNIWEKVWRSVLWIGNSAADVESADWDWSAKVDSDTFLFPENLRRYVNEMGWSPDDKHYFGHWLDHTNRRDQAPIVAGAAVIFSRAAVVGLASTFRGFEPFIENTNTQNCLDAHLGTGEETVTAICLKKNFNVSAHHALDSERRDLVSIMSTGHALAMDRSHALRTHEVWYWKNKPAGDVACCSHVPIVLHGCKDLRYLYQIELEVYGGVDPAHIAPSLELWQLYGPDPN